MGPLACLPLPVYQVCDSLTALPGALSWSCFELLNLRVNVSSSDQEQASFKLVVKAVLQTHCLQQSSKPDHSCRT